jgi:DNA-binding response OmpR family regulator
MYDEMFKKVLIVEDDFDFRNSLRDFLAAHNFAVSTADDGEQAMEKILVHRPDVIILDLLLPKVHGFEVLKRIRTYPDESVAKTPVVVLSNLFSPADLEKAKELHVAEYFVKSQTKLDAVLDKVKEILFGSGGMPQGDEVMDFTKDQ